jgi:hypothetical protein
MKDSPLKAVEEDAEMRESGALGEEEPREERR